MVQRPDGCPGALGDSMHRQALHATLADHLGCRIEDEPDAAPAARL
jgi:hypothetical protein